MSENMTDQETFGREDDQDEQPGTSGIEYIGNQPINGPLIGADQPVVDSAANKAPGDAEEIIEVNPDDTEPRPSEVDTLNWYVVHCYSGYENKVKHNLEQRIEAMGVADLIEKVVVPTEEEMEVHDGKRRTVEKRVFPGYILVHMKLDERALNVVRATNGVTRFVGMGSKPTPLTQAEVNQIMRRMQAEAPKLRVNFHTAQKVRITDGPFADFMGMVNKIDTERAKVTVLVSFFGRETPVELDFLQVERM
jgi:transcriptional antiterminator NusG